ncbi:hypothetical protein PPTG_22211 [Phytophthora nicotianae INRA-310]|uniref:Uncharacterized protein n=1 Tax=Phytophthora nicotianae (strain INRA-310) TaxID=761204 RepID=W2QNY6_PHYN3|nr:hypothetical protein PPTG_22211 [Phytophthora nicotianae INRA-310]ETN14219.1 hypothetical protein PPTG_22211 [Phytophthora nicotianae INRA-310]
MTSPIIELPEHYRVDGERLGGALAHVSAQANSIAEYQAELQHLQSRYGEEQRRFVEQRVAAAQEEATYGATRLSSPSSRLTATRWLWSIALTLVFRTSYSSSNMELSNRLEHLQRPRLQTNLR